MSNHIELERLKAEMDAARKAAQETGEAAHHAAWVAEAASYAADAAVARAAVCAAAYAAAYAAREADAAWVAHQFGDTVVPITSLQPDGIHPSWKGYKQIAEETGL